VSTIVETISPAAPPAPVAERPAERPAELSAERSAERSAGRYRRRWLAYSAVLVASVMDLLDSTVMGVAAPAIRADLGGSSATLQWMAAGYTLALAVLLLAGGRLGDLLGRKRALLVGVGGFTFASLLCALAVSPEMLIGSRVLQGAFAAVMLPQGFGLARDLFTQDEMTKAWGVFGPIMGLSAVVGPIVGGTLLDADLLGTGWRSIFLVNVPLGIASFAIAARFLPTSARSAESKLDVPGLLLAGAGVFALVFPLVQGRELGWPHWLQVLLAASGPVLGGFGWYQARRRRSGRATLVEPSVFRNRSYVSGVVFAIVFFGAMAGTFVLGMFLQIGLGYTAIHTSLTMAPWAFGAMVGAGVGGGLMAKLGRTLLHIGLATMAAGLIGMYAVLQATGAGVSHWDLVVPNLVGGAGMGMIFVPLFDIILGRVADNEIGSASGMLGSFEQLGIALGVAVIGSIFFGLLESPAGTGLAAHQAAALDGVQESLLATLGLIAVAFVIGFWLPKQARAGAGH
jgi:EmrB/QacA subfamily drug resistance transporter